MFESLITEIDVTIDNLKKSIENLSIRDKCDMIEYYIKNKQIQRLEEMKEVLELWQ